MRESTHPAGSFARSLTQSPSTIELRISGSIPCRMIDFSSCDSHRITPENLCYFITFVQ